MSGYRSSGGSRDEGESDPGFRGEHVPWGELADLGRVTGELLHDLGGILGVLSGRVALARDEAALGRIPTEELSRIQGDTDELRRMVVEILEEVKNRPRSLEVTFPVCATIDETVNRWLVGAPSVTTTLRSTLSPRAEIAGPRSFFSRSVGNLLRNAARHARSEIRVTLRPDEKRNAVQIRVEDDGEGVSAAVRENVFDPLVSASGTGTGFGLSFARWGIERLGGTLELVKEPTDLGGAAFLAELPLASIPLRRLEKSPSSPSRSAAATDPDGSLAGLRVAIVDDDPAVRRTLGRLLARSKAEPHEIDPSPWKSPDDAIRDLLAANPDVIVLDVNLHRVSGPEVARAMDRSAPDLVHRLLFMTGGTPPPELEEEHVVSKMIGWDEMVARILRVATHSPEGG